jgi:hypothetical protein
MAVMGMSLSETSLFYIMDLVDLNRAKRIKLCREMLHLGGTAPNQMGKSELLIKRRIRR